MAEGRLDTEDGRRAIEAFFDGFAAEDLRGAAKVLAAPGFSFSDVASKVVSLINLETVRAIGREIGANVHPLRFRGNLYVEGLPAWEEFGWVGKELAIGGVTFTVTKRIDRCAATNVDPETGGARPDDTRKPAQGLRPRRLRHLSEGGRRRNACRRRRNQGPVDYSSPCGSKPPPP